MTSLLEIIQEADTLAKAEPEFKKIREGGLKSLEDLRNGRIGLPEQNECASILLQSWKEATQKQVDIRKTLTDRCFSLYGSNRTLSGDTIYYACKGALEALDVSFDEHMQVRHQAYKAKIDSENTPTRANGRTLLERLAGLLHRNQTKSKSPSNNQR